MKSRIARFLKIAWLTAAIAILFMGTSLCLSTDDACFQAGETMFLLMFLLSFPTGLLFILVSTFFLGGESIHYPSDYITVWLIMTCGGYLQWFVLVPRLFAKREFTVLNLGQTDSPLKSLVKDCAPSPIRRTGRMKPISAFDRRGRTPLERAIARRL